MTKPTCGEQGYTLIKHTPAPTQEDKQNDWEKMDQRNTIKMTDKMCAITE